MRAKGRILNRKVHIYAGLILLPFVILFSGTGLLLNRHPAFAEFWPARTVTSYAADILRPAGGGDLEIARDLMRQLHLRGEINKTQVTPDGAFAVEIVRPGESVKVRAELATGHASVERTQTNGWGVVRALHTFIGVSLTEPERQRDWWLTRVWSLAVDATAIGIALLVMGGLYEAWAANPKHTGIVLTLIAAALVALSFIAGLPH